MIIGTKSLKKVRLDKWGFNENERVILRWINPPYKDLRNRWMIDVFFKGIKSRETKRHTVPIGTLKLLKINSIYSNGDLTKPEVEEDVMVDKFDITDVEFRVEYKEKDIKITDGPASVEIVSFIGKTNYGELHIPALEIIRTLLATNKFMLNRIVEVDSIGKYVLSYNDKEEDKLYLELLDEYPSTYLRNEDICQLAWIISDNTANRAYREVGASLNFTEKLEFSFPLKGQYRIYVRYKKVDRIYRIQEILDVEGIELDLNRVEVTGKYLKTQRKSNKEKIRTFSESEFSEGIIDEEKDGSASEDFNKRVRNYERRISFGKDIEIIRNKQGQTDVRTIEDESTEEFDRTDEGKVSSGDAVGGKLPNLEYEDLDSEEMVDGELEEFIELLKDMENQYKFLIIKYMIRELPKGNNGKKFFLLSDKKTPRKYCLAKIEFNNGRIVRLLEVERYGRSISILALESQGKIRWENIINQILVGLVNKSGTWDGDVIEKIKKNKVEIRRIRHLKETKIRQELINKYFYNISYR